MKPFEYNRAASVEHALDLKANHAPDLAQLLAGGTDLLTLMKAGVSRPDRLIDIKRLLDLVPGIEDAPDGITVSALTTLADLEDHEPLAQRHPLLREALRVTATAQLRRMATLGGNLLQRPRCWYFRNERFTCWLKGGETCPARSGRNEHHGIFGDSPCVAVHPSDLAACLIAADAEVRLRGRHAEERVLPVESFFAMPRAERRRESVLENELLTSVRIPNAPGMRSTYVKAMDRKAWGFALVGVAAAVRIENGTYTAARIALSGVAPVPWRAAAAEERLMGRRTDDVETARAAARAAARDAVALAHNGYKIPLLQALVREALRRVSVERPEG